jgi:GAF domain-containing protein
VTYTEHELERLILANPLDDRLRVQLEELLLDTEPDGVDIELLRRERHIAEALEAVQSISELIDEYKQFRITQSNYFWDLRGCSDHLFRPFSLWLVACVPDRLFALNVAIRNKLNREFDPACLPLEIARGLRPDAAYETMRGIFDFVRRYRGPTGNEPDLVDDEITIEMLATYSSKYTAR